MIDRGLVSVRPMLVLTVLDIIISIIWTFVSAWAYSKLYQPRKMLIVYGDQDPEDFMRKMMKRRDKFSIREKSI